MERNSPETWIRRNISAVVATLLLAVLTVGCSRGKGLEVLSSVNEGNVIHNDLLLTGFDGVIEGDVIGNVFAIGKDLTVNGDVEGSLFVIGDKVTVNGNIKGGTYVLGVSFEQGSTSSIDLNLYFIGINIRTVSGSRIGRDLSALAMAANLTGEVGRGTHAIIGFLEFMRLLGEGLNQGIMGKSMLPLATAQRELGYGLAGVGKAAPVLGQPLALAASTANPGSAFEAIKAEEVNEIILNCVTALVAFLIVGGLALWLLPTLFEVSVRQLRKKPMASAGIGALVFVNGFLLAGLLFALILGVGLGLRFLTLTDLAWGFWGVAFSGLGLAFSLFIVSVVWLSKALVAFLVGILILDRLYPRALEYKVVPLFLGLAIYLALCLIPLVGSTMAFIITLFGLGGLFLGIRKVAREDAGRLRG